MDDGNDDNGGDGDDDVHGDDAGDEDDGEDDNVDDDGAFAEDDDDHGEGDETDEEARTRRRAALLKTERACVQLVSEVRTLPCWKTKGVEEFRHARAADTHMWPARYYASGTAPLASVRISLKEFNARAKARKIR